MHSVSTMPVAIAFAFLIWFVAHQKANETPASKAIIGWQHFWFAIFMFLVVHGCFQNAGNVDRRIFVFVPESQEYDDSLRIADEYAQKVNEMTEFKPDPHFFKGDGGFAVRGQILIYEKVPEKNTQISAEES